MPYVIPVQGQAPIKDTARLRQTEVLIRMTVDLSTGNGLPIMVVPVVGGQQVLMVVIRRSAVLSWGLQIHPKHGKMQ